MCWQFRQTVWVSQEKSLKAIRESQEYENVEFLEPNTTSSFSETCHDEILEETEIESHMQLQELSSEAPIEVSVVSSGRLRTYERNEDGRFICQICQGTYSSKDTLSRHIFKHSRTKDFKCHLCPREFYFKRDHDFHLKQHFNPQKVECPECGSGFGTNSALKKHLATICSQTKAVLNNHHRVHKHNKPFPCLICHTAFSQKIMLQRHMKSLHNENIYHCEWCGSSFEKHGMLRKHWMACDDMRNRGDYEKPLDVEN